MPPQECVVCNDILEGEVAVNCRGVGESQHRMHRECFAEIVTNQLLPINRDTFIGNNRRIVCPTCRAEYEDGDIEHYLMDDIWEMYFEARQPPPLPPLQECVHCFHEIAENEGAVVCNGIGENQHPMHRACFALMVTDQLLRENRDVFIRHNGMIVCQYCIAEYEDGDIENNVGNELWNRYLEARQPPPQCVRCLQNIPLGEDIIMCRGMGENQHPMHRACFALTVTDQLLPENRDIFIRHDGRIVCVTCYAAYEDGDVENNVGNDIWAMCLEARQPPPLPPLQECVYCLNDIFENERAVLCRGIGENRHSMHANECFSEIVTHQLRPNNRDDFTRHNGRIVCTNCYAPYEDVDIQNNIAYELWNRYLVARQPPPQCVRCLQNIPLGEDIIMCRGMGEYQHPMHRACFALTVTDQLLPENRDIFIRHDGRIVCVTCYAAYEDGDIENNVANELWNRYFVARQPPPQCVSCLQNIPLVEDIVMCRGMGEYQHPMHRACFALTVTDQLLPENRDIFIRHDGRIVCVTCYAAYEDGDVENNVANELWNRCLESRRPPLPPPPPQPPLQECVICLNETLENERPVVCRGIGENRHHMHKACFSLNVSHQIAAENRIRFRANDRNIVCPNCFVVFEDREIINNVENEIWNDVKRARDDVQLQIAAEELEMRRRAEEDRRREAAGSREGRVILHRNHIIENILTLKCPRCRQAIYDFQEGDCFAITCACNCRFCGWCLTDCGDDAHPHVRACPLNPRPNRLFAPVAEFHRNHNERRRQSVQQYLDSDAVAAEDRQYVLEAITGDLRNLNIEVI